MYYILLCLAVSCQGCVNTDALRGVVGLDSVCAALSDEGWGCTEM
jgi:hypothetical protein